MKKAEQEGFYREPQPRCVLREATDVVPKKRHEEDSDEDNFQAARAAKRRRTEILKAAPWATRQAARAAKRRRPGTPKAAPRATRRRQINQPGYYSV